MPPGVLLLGGRTGVFDDGGGGGGDAGQGAGEAGRTGTTMTLPEAIGQGLGRGNECVAFPVVVIFLRGGNRRGGGGLVGWEEDIRGGDRRGRAMWADAVEVKK